MCKMEKGREREERGEKGEDKREEEMQRMEADSCMCAYAHTERTRIPTMLLGRYKQKLYIACLHPTQRMSCDVS